MDDACDALDTLLRDSILKWKRTRLSEAFSGRYSTNRPVALMQIQSARPVKTFTIGFHEAEFNEAGYAAAVARHRNGSYGAGRDLAHRGNDSHSSAAHAV